MDRIFPRDIIENCILPCLDLWSQIQFVQSLHRNIYYKEIIIKDYGFTVPPYHYNNMKDDLDQSIDIITGFIFRDYPTYIYLGVGGSGAPLIDIKSKQFRRIGNKCILL